MLLDELLVLHHVELQVTHGKLPRETDLRRRSRQAMKRQRSDKCVQYRLDTHVAPPGPIVVLIRQKRAELSRVMPALVAGIHVYTEVSKARRGWRWKSG